MTWGQSQEVISGMRLQNERKVHFLMKKKPTYDIINQLLGGNVMIVLLDSLGNTARFLPFLRIRKSSWNGSELFPFRRQKSYGPAMTRLQN